MFSNLNRLSAFSMEFSFDIPECVMLDLLAADDEDEEGGEEKEEKMMSKE